MLSHHGRQARHEARTKGIRITTKPSINLHPTPSAPLALIAFCGAQSHQQVPRSIQELPTSVLPPAQRPSSSFNMQATMSPVPFPIPMLPHSPGPQTATASRIPVSNLVAPLLRQPSGPSLHAPAPQRLVRHATAPEPRTCTPHPSRNKRKASFHELSPEVAERPSKRPKIDQDNSGRVAIHVGVGGSSQN